MKKKYHIEGIDCANCAAKVEKKMNELPYVNVTLTFATSQLLVEAENPDEILPKLKEIADNMEPGTVIEEIGKTKSYSGKNKPHHHEHHHHHDGDKCCCGEQEGHHHHHDGDNCCCGENEGHEDEKHQHGEESTK